jgi:hypothetical protein
VKAIDRPKRERLRQSIRRLETLVGEVEVQRTLYQGDGVSYLAPLEGVVALSAAKYSHEVRRMAAEESVRSSFDKATETIEKRTGAHVPKRQVEELTVRAAQDFDAFYADRLEDRQTIEMILVEKSRTQTKRAARGGSPTTDRVRSDYFLQVIS